MNNAKKSWSSILTGVADTTAEYVFEPGDDDKLAKLPPRIDDKVAAIERLMRRRVELQAEAHRIDLDIARHQDAIAEQLKAVGMLATRQRVSE